MDLVTTHNAGDLTQFINPPKQKIDKGKSGKKETEGRKKGYDGLTQHLFNPQRNHNSHLTCFESVSNYPSFI